MGRKSSLKKKRSRDKKAMSSEEIIIPGDAQGAPLSDGQEEKILVSVRLRPLNEREIARNDVSDWECINNSTIIFKNSLPERSMFPAAYTFDRVFGSDSPTKQVYEEGAKEVILSVVSGINSSIFAYGQTSSGKTYTMSGITEYAVQDIYDYIDRHNEREFVLKFSAMEIYNEAVRDLLSTDPTPLRLLDDPERGTVVEKLTEEIVEDMNHLMELLSFCEAQRQIGETTLNENSSRSHQILRLTIESSARQYLGAENSSTLAATVNFVDLAGSERASQTLSAGTRLKEGCHINRSLLTLGTVIRKLSKGRNAHIPFRDSKLTRILQNSLGGNAKTAIICTMSPARSHVEQSRNTLLFASCAKEVATNAQVNVVMSDKALVKQLQRELVRLENEMKGISSTPDKSDSTELLKEKELRIAQMEKEIQELTRQRDLAQSKIENLLQSVGKDGASRQDNKGSAIESLYVPRPLHSVPGHGEYNAAKNFNSPRMFDLDPQYIQLSESAEDNFLLDDSTPKFNGHVPCPGWEEIAQKTDEESEDSCKEVRCIENEEPNKDRKVKIDDLSSSPAEKDGMDLLMNRVIDEEVATFPEKEDKELIAFNNDRTCNALKQKIQELQKTVKYLLSLYPLERSPCHTEADVRFLKGSRMKRSMSCRAILMTTPTSLWLDKLDENEFTPTAISEKDFHGRAGGFYQKLSELKYNNAKAGKISRKDSEASISSSGSLESHSIKELDAGYGSNIHDIVVGSNETVKNKSQKQGASDLVHERANETGESTNNVKDVGQDKMKDDTQANSNWSTDFERQRREIMELWNACNVPLIHRTYFFLLFKGDPSDSVYLEVELRRLSFLKAKSPNGKTNIAKDSLTVSPASSLKELQREREMLSKQIHRKMSRKEREGHYKKWGIALNTKQRSLQLAQRLWTDTKDIDHVNQSASLVAKLVGFVEPGQAPKEMFGLSFLPQTTSRRSYRWRHSLSSQL